MFQIFTQIYTYGLEKKPIFFLKKCTIEKCKTLSMYGPNENFFMLYSILSTHWISALTVMLVS